MATTEVTSGVIKDASITSAKMAANSVDSASYVDGSIDPEHLADNAVTLAKMASGVDGNIISFDSSGNPVAIATGNDGQVLTSAGAGAQPAFEDAGGGGLDYFRAAMGGDQSIPQNTVTKLVFNSEVYDTASKYAPSTNYRWTPAAGAVFIHAQTQMNINANVLNQLMLYKNGSEIQTAAYKQYSGARTANLSFISTCNGSDYFELYYHHNDSGAESLQANDSTFFGMVIA
mgnify:CR=1 FL=1